MIGIVLSGHGKFASGLNSSIQLIAGKQEGFEVVDFLEGMSSEALQQALQKAVESVDQGQGLVKKVCNNLYKRKKETSIQKWKMEYKKRSVEICLH